MFGSEYSYKWFASDLVMSSAPLNTFTLSPLVLNSLKKNPKSFNAFLPFVFAETPSETLPLPLFLNLS